MTKRCEEREIFSKKMIDILNYGALNLAVGIGYRVGLFEVLDTFDSPQTLSSIADKAGLSSRYVREWMGVMVCGGVVELSVEGAGENFYYLPKGYSDVLTRRAQNENL